LGEAAVDCNIVKKREHRGPQRRHRDRPTSMETNEITQIIIGCAINVHKQLGPGLLESAYEECLAYELEKSGLKIQRQIPVPIIYKEKKLDFGYRMDLLVEEVVLVELKAVEAFNPVHQAQLLTYMKFAKKHTGLMINFNVTKLSEGIKRYKM
jgi:GxxExxY protein